MFGAVVCPRCRKGFAVDLEHDTSSCPHCGRQVQTRRLKTYFTSASASLTAKAVGDLNRRERDLRTFDGEAMTEKERTSPSPKDMDVVLAELGEFTPSELAARLEMKDADELVSRLLLTGSIYESSLGRFRKA
jgi:hypothetical protein